VWFTYTYQGQTYSVPMSYQGGSQFAGTLGPLSPPAQNYTLIPVRVMAKDAAGNTASRGPFNVTIHKTCLI